MPPRDLVETFSLLIRTLAPLGLAYLHLTEPRISGMAPSHPRSLLSWADSISGQAQANADSGYGLPESLDWAAGLWFGHPDAENDVAKSLGAQVPASPQIVAKANVLVLAGGYTRESAITRLKTAKERGERVVIAFGRQFIANPDLPARIIKGIELNKYNRATFYKAESPDGYVGCVSEISTMLTPGSFRYIDYPFASGAEIGL